jgi:hypothetical protein
MLVNAHDQTINRTLIDDLVAAWRARGASVETYGRLGASALSRGACPVR